MRAALVTTVLGAALIGPPLAGAAAGPGPSQIARAVARAERSSALWATVNICSPRPDPGALGIRGQMPTLGFAATLAMEIQVNYWATGQRRFEPIHAATATTTLALGQQRSGLQQDGAIFPFKARTGRLDATVTFTWTRAGRVIGQTVRRTTAGHPAAAYGSPPHYSAAQCAMN